MGYIEGLLGGFAQRTHEIQQENIRANELARNRESAFYSHLLTSDDPNLRAMAATGLMEGMAPTSSRRKKGVAGFFGEMEQSPYYQPILNYLNTPQNLPVRDQYGIPQLEEVPGEQKAEPASTEVPSTAGMPTAKPATQGGPPPRPETSVPGPVQPEAAAASMAPPPPASLATNQGMEAALPNPQAMAGFAAPPQPTAAPPQTTNQMLAQHAYRQKMAMQLPQAFLSPTETAGRMDVAKAGAAFASDLSTFRDYNLSQGMDLNTANSKAMESAMFMRMMRSGGWGMNVFGGSNIPFEQLSPQEQTQVQQQYGPHTPGRLYRRVGSSKVPGMTEVMPISSGFGGPEGVDKMLNDTMEQSGINSNDPGIQQIVGKYRPILQAQIANGQLGMGGANGTIREMLGEIAQRNRGYLQTNRPLSQSEEAEVPNLVGAIQRDRGTGLSLLRSARNPALENRVLKELMAKGIMPNELDASDKQMANAAETVRPMINQVLTMGSELNRLGLMGPIASRWREFMTTEFGSSQLTTKAKQYEGSYVDDKGNLKPIQMYTQADPESAADFVQKQAGRPLTAQERELVGQFQSQLEFLRTAAARAHGGARAAGSVMMMGRFDQVINAVGDFDLFLGNLRSTDAVMKNYQGFRGPGGIRPLSLEPWEMTPGGQTKPVGAPPAPGGQPQAAAAPATNGQPVYINNRRVVKDPSGKLVYFDTHEPVQ